MKSLRRKPSNECKLIVKAKGGADKPFPLYNFPEILNNKSSSYLEKNQNRKKASMKNHQNDRKGSLRRI